MESLLTAPSYKARIIVVEDEIIVARDIQQQLLGLGYETIAHTSFAEEAIVLAEKLAPDLILMDIHLAGAMDGITAAQIIRTQLGLPVVFISAFEADEILARAKLTEPFGYILKPFAERELRTVLEMALYKRDVELQQREAALHQKSIFENMLDGLITVDSEGVMESFNQSACGIFGYSAEEVIGKNLSMLMPEPHRSLHDHFSSRHLEAGGSRIIGVTREVDGRRKNGSHFPMSLSISTVTRGARTTYIGLFRDITRRRCHEQEITRLAFYDLLTQLPNRRLLLDRLQHAMHTSSRNGQHGALMFLDLDHFKLVNDSHGHSVADELLRQVALRLQAAVRDGDSVARLGGDEFVILMENLSDSAFESAIQAEHLAAKILIELAEPYTLAEHHYHSSASVGITLFFDEQEALGDILKKADTAMYQAKKAGRNTLRFYDPVMQEAAQVRSQLESNLRAALQAKEFLLHYQVQVNALGAVTGVEALVRWNSPTRGLLLPATFIPVAEDIGVILSLGQWVLETACAQLFTWASLPARAYWTMAVNVSVLQFAHPDFVANVSLALQQSGADPRLLKLEITESMFAVNVDFVIAKMVEIKALGVTFALDDFGTGYSSLSFLKHLPLDQLKIDQTFVRNLMRDPHDAIIAKAIIVLAKSFGLTVIAEGVETLEQRNYLAEMGCNAYQGYYFGRPLAINALEATHPPVVVQ